jgi:hypothetical protein
MARAENRAVFHGWQAAGITGIAEASSHDAITLGEDCEQYPRHVAQAVQALLHAGIGGPYGLALGPDPYTRVLETTEHGGYPLFDHLREIIGGPLVWAPGVEGAVVVSQRGGDFLFDSGEDLSIGYDRHDFDAVDLSPYASRRRRQRWRSQPDGHHLATAIRRERVPPSCCVQREQPVLSPVVSRRSSSPKMSDHATALRRRGRSWGRRPPPGVCAVLRIVNLLPPCAPGPPRARIRPQTGTVHANPEERRSV